MQKLIDHRIPFGAITVLARNTLPYVQQIYRFYNRLEIESRFLPFYMDAFDSQIADHAISYAELVAALKSLFDEWIVSDQATSVAPVDEYIDYAVAHVASRCGQHYHRETDEYVFIVDLDGGVWGQGEAYEPDCQYGNLADQGFGEILTSKAPHLAIERAGMRCDRYCRQCPYFGACPGHFVSDSSPQQQRLLKEAGCPVSEVLDHIVGTLRKTGLTDVIAKHANRPPKDVPVMVNL
jgi:uncharacterized protein